MPIEDGAVRSAGDKGRIEDAGGLAGGGPVLGQAPEG